MNRTDRLVCLTAMGLVVASAGVMFQNFRTVNQINESRKSSMRALLFCQREREKREK